MRKLIDITGERFGKWTVVAHDGVHGGKRHHWLCVCDCGTVRPVDGSSLRRGLSTSCGKCNPPANRKHGLSGDITACDHRKKKGRSVEYVMWGNAKQRARKAGLSFDIKPTDIVTPDVCPCLGMRLERGVGTQQRNSPSLDRINSALGYTKGNVWVISQKANAIKNDATVDELMQVAVQVALRNGADPRALLDACLSESTGTMGVSRCA